MASERTLRLRPSVAADLDWLLAAEAEEAVRPRIIAWSRERHLAAFGDEDLAHLVAQRSDGDDGRVGFVILAGLRDANRSVEFRRLVITRPGEGHGFAAINAVRELAFGRHGAHRLWLDVKQDNERARHLYRRAGFKEEGVMRECLLGPRGYESLVLMSMLAGEHAALGAGARG